MQRKFPESPVWNFCAAAVSGHYDPFAEPFPAGALNSLSYEDLTKYSPDGRPVIRCDGNTRAFRFYYYKDTGEALTKEQKEMVKQMEKKDKPFLSRLNPMNAFRSMQRSGASDPSGKKLENPYGQGGGRRKRKTKSRMTKKRMTKRRR
jgi:hypothetical protein